MSTRSLARLSLLHRRLAVGMALASLLAFARSAGFEPLSVLLAGCALVLALFWHPSPETSARLERVWLPLAVILVVRALYHLFWVRGDVVIPVVDLLLLLLSAEALRSLDASNDARLYSLSFALILASTAYRPGVVFAGAFVAYVVLGTLALVVGHLRRQAMKNRVREIAIGPSFLMGMVGLSGVALAMSAGVFLTFPRVSQSWSGQGQVLATSVAGFSDEVSLESHGARIYSNPEVVLRVEFDGEAPADPGGLYWRGRSYDRFDGVRWHRSEDLPPAVAPPSWYRERWGGPEVTQRIFAAPLDVRVLFGLHPILGMDPEAQIQPVFDNAGDFTYWGSGMPTYTAFSMSEPPPAERLRSAPDGRGPARFHYVQLPVLPERVEALADSLTRGIDNRYDRVLAIQRWLRSLTYTLELPSDPSLDHFLFERQAGHCEYFSTAMVMLLRSQEIPARNVNGFLGGQWNDFGEYLAVTQNEAHSWVEVWFPGYGWVPFDPTPGSTGGQDRAGIAFLGLRSFFDGLQHRWGKWVLDYDVESQWSLLDRLGALRGDAQVSGGAGDESTGGARLLLWAALLLAAVFVLARRFGRRADAPPETRLYVALRDACHRAGMGAASTPGRLLQALRERDHPASPAASRLVDLYLRSRFGGKRLDESTRAEMRQALDEARGRLRRQAVAE